MNNKLTLSIIGACTLLTIITLFIVAVIDSWQSTFWFIAFLIALISSSYNVGKRQQSEEINDKLSQTIKELSETQGKLLLQTDLLYGMLPRNEEEKGEAENDNTGNKNSATD